MALTSSKYAGLVKTFVIYDVRFAASSSSEIKTELASEIMIISEDWLFSTFIISVTSVINGRFRMNFLMSSGVT